MSLRATAEDVVRRTLAAPATLGTGRLLAIDGPAGSGKTTLAAAVVDAVPPGHPVDPFQKSAPAGVHVVEVHHLRGHPRRLVGPLARDEPGGYRRYDWLTEQEAEWHEVAPAALLVLEGVGAGCSGYAEHISTLVWVEAPHDVRLARGVERDVELYGLHGDRGRLEARWRAWMADEQALHDRDRTRQRADVVVEGVG